MMTFRMGLPLTMRGMMVASGGGMGTSLWKCKCECDDCDFEYLRPQWSLCLPRGES